MSESPEGLSYICAQDNCSCSWHLAAEVEDPAVHLQNPHPQEFMRINVAVLIPVDLFVIHLLRGMWIHKKNVGLNTKWSDLSSILLLTVYLDISFRWFSYKLNEISMLILIVEIIPHRWQILSVIVPTGPIKIMNLAAYGSVFIYSLSQSLWYSIIHFELN